eukprot:538575_1
MLNGNVLVMHIISLAPKWIKTIPKWIPKFDSIFYKCHWILFILMSIFIGIHIWRVQYNLSSLLLAIYGISAIILDILFRLYSLFFQRVIISNIKLLSSNVIRIKFNKSFGFKYLPGQYLFLNILSINLFEFHPFSISSSPFNEESIMIHIRILGDWTKKLQKLISHYEEIGNGNYNYNNLICFMEGPYGELSIPIYNGGYKHLIVISGDIDIIDIFKIIWYKSLICWFIIISWLMVIIMAMAMEVIISMAMLILCTVLMVIVMVIIMVIIIIIIMVIIMVMAVILPKVIVIILVQKIMKY